MAQGTAATKGGIDCSLACMYVCICTYAARMQKERKDPFCSCHSVSGGSGSLPCAENSSWVKQLQSGTNQLNRELLPNRYIYERHRNVKNMPYQMYTQGAVDLFSFFTKLVCWIFVANSRLAVGDIGRTVASLVPLSLDCIKKRGRLDSRERWNIDKTIFFVEAILPPTDSPNALQPPIRQFLSSERFCGSFLQIYFWLRRIFMILTPVIWRDVAQAWIPKNYIWESVSVLFGLACTMKFVVSHYSYLSGCTLYIQVYIMNLFLSVHFSYI